MTMYTIEQRKKILVPTAGSQRRCYNGCFPSSDWEEGYTDWDWLSINVPEDEVDDKLAYWRKLTAYSKSVGGKGNSEYRAVLNKEEVT